MASVLCCLGQCGERNRAYARHAQCSAGTDFDLPCFVRPGGRLALICFLTVREAALSPAATIFVSALLWPFVLTGSRRAGPIQASIDSIHRRLSWAVSFYCRGCFRRAA